MSAVNPYTPPRADVADVSAAPITFQELRYWSTKGRIGRVRYLAWTSIASLIAMAVIGVLAAILASKGNGAGFGVAMVLGYVPLLIFIVLALIQRSHDMGWSGWTCLLAFIPFVGLIWLFKAGTPGENQYGAPPPPNSRGVVVAAWLCLGLPFIIGILAAIALPAYQDYVKRAKAVQMQTQPPLQQSQQ
ncbi:MAG: DUF805 domain-containing protein [Rhizobacter sp.]